MPRLAVATNDRRAIDFFDSIGQKPTSALRFQRLNRWGDIIRTTPRLPLGIHRLRARFLSRLHFALARVEAQKIGERTKAGMARARAAGKHVGRPTLSQATRNAIDKCAASGFRPYKIAKDLRIDRKTILKYIYREVLQAAE